MGIKFLSSHTIKPGDTLESLARDYRLSSWRAVAEIESNWSLIGQFPARSKLPVGTLVRIPPNAGDLVKERLYLLHRIRPAFLTHFDQQRSVVENDLHNSFLGPAAQQDSGAIANLLHAMQSEVHKAIAGIAKEAWPLVSICAGMTHTHVAQAVDRMAAATSGDSLCGLYWAITPPVLRLWQEIWQPETWAGKWAGREPDAAWLLAHQFQNTVGSLVVQQIDQRLREAQKLERNLQQEGYQ
jgi:hypothetical protein